MFNYEIIHSKPPIWSEIVKQFDIKSPKRVAITCGNKIYYEGELPKDILEHELIHVRQQTEDMSEKEWWEKYLSDAEFRYEQELEAYRHQIDYVSRFVTDRNKMHKYRSDIAASLSGPMYGVGLKYSKVYGDLK